MPGHTRHRSEPGALRGSAGGRAPSTCQVAYPRLSLLRGSQVLTGGIDKDAKLFSRTKGSVLATLKGHSKRISGVSFVPGGDRLVTCSHDKTVRVWAKSGALSTCGWPRGRRWWHCCRSVRSVSVWG